jgi:hypothetical protein
MTSFQDPSSLISQAGDRLMVLPKNDRRLVTLTINSLLATGDEMIPLDATWRKAFAGQSKYRNKSVPERLPLWEVLERAQVSRALVLRKRGPFRLVALVHHDYLLKLVAS